MMDNVRPVSYKEYSTWQQGWCLLITGGMMSEPIMVIERSDGTITQIPIDKVQFNDRILKVNEQEVKKPYLDLLDENIAQEYSEASRG